MKRRVLKEKTSTKKKKKRKEEEKKRKLTELTHSATPASADDLDLKQVHIPSLQWLTVFRNKFFGFLYNYGIFNWM